MTPRLAFALSAVGFVAIVASPLIKRKLLDAIENEVRRRE